MSPPNLDHSAVYYTESGQPCCWADLQGCVFAPPVPADILAKHPPRHRSPLGYAHPGVAESCLWCHGLTDGAMDRCGTMTTGTGPVEPDTTGNIRPAVATCKQSLQVAPNWSESVLIVTCAAVATLSIGGLLVVVIAQCLP